MRSLALRLAGVYNTFCCFLITFLQLFKSTDGVFGNEEISQFTWRELPVNRLFTDRGNVLIRTLSLYRNN